MKKWKTYQIGLFIALCILLNYGGRLLSTRFEMPLWLDAFGTALCAYIGGPVCGAIVGLTANLIYGMAVHSSVIYALTSMALGIIVGLAAKKDKLSTMFGTMSVSAVAAFTSIAISVPLNIIFHNGSTGNLWGDGVIGFWRERGVPLLLCRIFGQFYLDFMDKLLTLVLLHVVVRLIGKRQGDGEARDDDPAGPKAGQALGALLILALCLAPAPARAEESAPGINDYNNYVQTVYSSNNGLPCGEANDIAQTNDGILWIGTYAGLYRYNGQEFRWMDSYDSVRNVNTLYVDEEGRLWIGTNDNGLSICINEKIVNVVDQSRGLPSNSVRSIIQSSDGYYYIGTTGSMQILTLSNGLKRVSTLREINYADKIAADENGHVAVITSDGRMFLLRGGQIQSSLRLTDGELFNSCCFDKDGWLLAGTSTNHLYIFDISDGGFEQLEMRTCEGLSNMNDLYPLDSGELFISADNGVGYISREEDFHNVNTNDFNNSIDNMLIDYQGNLWFTSSRLGLLRMAPSPFKDVYSTAGMSARVVNTVTFWRGEYYFGTDKGLDVVDEHCNQQVHNALTEQLQGVRIRCMLVDSAGSLWICTYGSGLLEVEPDGAEHLYNSENGSFGNRARVVAELSDGSIMAAGDTGISFIRDHEVERTIGYADGLINSMILTITERADGTILAGTDGDGIAVLKNGEVDHMLTREHGLSSEVILRMVKDTKSEGVFVVTSNGLCYMDEAENIRPLENFPYFNNYDVWARDEDTLFVMSSAGIYVVERDDLLSGRPELEYYDLLDNRRGLNSALTANSWNYCNAAGNLFLPCDRGVFIIDTARYTALTSAYRMSVASVRLDGEPQVLERGRPIEVGRGVNKIELHPEIINYTIQDPNVGYYLEGFDRDWTVLPQSALGTITYTNLASGDYIFHLAVFDNSSENILVQRDYQITKSREIYDNQWFVIYIIIVPMLAVIWFTWYIMRTRIQRMLDIQRRELALAHQQIQMGNETIIAIANAVDAKDERTSQHSKRVSEYSVMIAREMGFKGEELENLRRTALMHDIGKIGIPDSILNKPARLTDEEYAVMKSHVTRGAEILKDFTLLEHVVEGARYHHERYDGRGYPDGLKGEEIPLYGRIIGVADAFDAMTANRVYRKQMDFGYVLNEMRNGRGTQFDPKIVDILLRLIDEGKIDLNALYPVKAEAEEAR